MYVMGRNSRGWRRAVVIIMTVMVVVVGEGGALLTLDAESCYTLVDSIKGIF